MEMAKAICHCCGNRLCEYACCISTHTHTQTFLIIPRLTMDRTASQEPKWNSHMPPGSENSSSNSGRKHFCDLESRKQTSALDSCLGSLGIRQHLTLLARFGDAGASVGGSFLALLCSGHRPHDGSIWRCLSANAS